MTEVLDQGSDYRLVREQTLVIERRDGAAWSAHHEFALDRESQARSALYLYRHGVDLKTCLCQHSIDHHDSGLGGWGSRCARCGCDSFWANDAGSPLR